MKTTGKSRKGNHEKPDLAPPGATPRNYGLPCRPLKTGIRWLADCDRRHGRSGRSTQIALLTEWLESEGFAVETMGLRRSGLVAKDIDALLAENTITRMTLTLMYATDFYDQLGHRIIPALRSDFVVLADRYFLYSIARAAARGIQREY